MKKKVEVDYKRASQLAKFIISQKENPLIFRGSETFPDSIVPHGLERGGFEHSLYLFHAVSVDSMRQSEKVYQSMQEILSNSGTMRNLHRMGREKIESLLIPYFGAEIVQPRGSMTDPVGTLLHNAESLEHSYNGDPRLIVGENVRETLRNISEFRQFGVPKSALLIKNFVRHGIWDFPESSIPIKVDRHVIRVSLGYRVVNIEEHLQTLNSNGNLANALEDAKSKLIGMGHYNESDFSDGKVRMVRGDKLVIPLTEAYLRVTSRERISAIDLDDLWWATGSKGCKRNDAIYCETSCPVRCYTRPPSDNNANWFFPDVDKRKNQHNLFTRTEN